MGSSLVMRWNTPGNKFETALPLTMVEQHLFQDDPALWAAATFYVGGDSKSAAAISRDLSPGFAVSNQKGESERFLALNTRHLRREKFG